MDLNISSTSSGYTLRPSEEPALKVVLTPPSLSHPSSLSSSLSLSHIQCRVHAPAAGDTLSC